MAANPWNESNLLAILRDIVRQGDIRLCLFIDGLDEFGDGKATSNSKIVDVVQTLIAESSSSRNLKLLIASRPLRLFSDVFAHRPQLTMQAMNEYDIRKYVDRELGEKADEEVRREILQKARGVFLWVTLAVQSLKAGISYEDDPSQLRMRLNDLPDGLQQLFGHMLAKIDPVHYQEVATYFRVAELGERKDTCL